MTKFMKLVGGKRGLAIIAGVAITALTQLGVIPPHVGEVLNVAAAGLGVTGIVHANLKSE